MKAVGDAQSIKRCESDKAQAGDSWRREKITLKPLDPDFKPIVLTGAEFIEVLGSDAKD